MDIPARETLESAFRVYKGTMLFISHDRYFIEQVADALLIFENGQVSYYPFGYRHYMERLERMNQFRAAGVSEEDAAVVLGQMESDCDAALQQIEEKMYAREYEDEYDHILCYGIAFYKKRCLVKTI